ncbi:MAG: site-specific DNA-methyltransferase [Gemmatimonadetes bacterium]|nr:site-specific DNA-methyltransferase [Gemmatimonadota bacterium]MYI45324.1 site-specific DNA-methyltransferase [Gemmatimonadota bacterium]
MSFGPTLFGNGGPEHRTLYYGDCLDWMSQWDSRTVDLIYLDPPFNSSAGYNVLFTDRGAGKAQYRAFDDTWHWTDKAEARMGVYEGAGGRPAAAAIRGLYQILGRSGMMAYVTYMAERLEQMKRLLKPTGSIFLHCDPTVNGYLRVVMDAIFGAESFRNEIVWCYRGMTPKSNRFNAKHDTLLYYANREARFNRQKGSPTPGSLKTYRSAQKRGYNANHARNMVVVFDRQKYEAAVEQGVIPAGMRETEFDGGAPWLTDWWADIKILGGPKNRERLGYPTQKPRALLERIIKAASDEGDLVLDPFCGCGTAIDAANRLKRRWAGIDISSFAIDLIRDRRMADHDINVKGMPFELRGAEKLAKEKPFQFESWAIMRMPGFVPNTDQVADGGVDGRATLATKPTDHESRRALAQVKSGKFSLSQLRDFLHVTDAHKAALGVYVTLHPVTSQNAKIAAYGPGTVTVGAEQYPRCQLWSIADYFDDRRPNLPTMTDPYTGKPLTQQELFASKAFRKPGEGFMPLSDGGKVDLWELQEAIDRLDEGKGKRVDLNALREHFED